MKQLAGITRLDVVDFVQGRAYSRRSVVVSAAVQDGGRTLKLFVDPAPRPTTGAEPGPVVLGLLEGRSMAPTTEHLDRVFNLLLEAGSRGVTGPEFVEKNAGWRFGACIFVLRKKGWKISSQREAGRVWRYTMDAAS